MYAEGRSCKLTDWEKVIVAPDFALSHDIVDDPETFLHVLEQAGQLENRVVGESAR